METRNPVDSEDYAVAALRASISTASFWAPEQLGPQPAWLEHGPFSFWLIEALRPRLLVELGTHGGYSYFTFCQTVQRLGLDTRCYAVDLWTGDEHAGFYGEEVYEQVHARNEKLYSGFSTLIRSTFAAALSRFDDRTIDLLHIDGRHFYEDVKEDFESWRPKLSDRAVVLFHDTNVHERYFGVFKLWEELCARYPYFEFTHGHGLGVLGVGSDLPAPIRLLFAASRDASATAAVRNAYSRLGLVNSLQFSLPLAVAENRAAVLAELSELWSVEVASAQNRAAELEKALAASAAELAAAREEAENRAAVLAQLLELRSLEVASAQNRAAELEKALAASAAELAAARESAVALKAQLTRKMRSCDPSGRARAGGWLLPSVRLPGGSPGSYKRCGAFSDCCDALPFRY